MSKILGLVLSNNARHVTQTIAFVKLDDEIMLLLEVKLGNQ